MSMIKEGGFYLVYLQSQQLAEIQMIPAMDAQVCQNCGCASLCWKLGHKRDAKKAILCCTQ